MSTNYQSQMRRRAVTVVAVTVAVVFSSGLSQICVGQEAPTLAVPSKAEPLPSLESAQSNGLQAHPECEYAPSDSPLSTLNTDIRTRYPGKDKSLVPENELPFSCATLKPVQQLAMSVDLSGDDTYYPENRELLSMAHFCHKPLYFNDDCLERCGVKSCCCQPCASAMCFYGGALLMPVRMWCECPCSCVPSGGCCR